MARNDGIDRTSARNVNLTAAKIGNAQRHNEREKESYTNPDIIPERTPQNIHFKKPSLWNLFRTSTKTKDITRQEERR